MANLVGPTWSKLKYLKNYIIKWNQEYSMRFCIDIHVYQRKNPNDFADSKTILLAPAIASQKLKIYYMDYTKKYVS